MHFRSRPHCPRRDLDILGWEGSWYAETWEASMSWAKWTVMASPGTVFASEASIYSRGTQVATTVSAREGFPSPLLIVVKASAS